MKRIGYAELKVVLFVSFTIKNEHPKLQLLIFWLINRYLLGGRIRLIYRIVLSVVLPLLFLGGMIGHSYYEPYSTSIMNNRLKDIGMDVKLPSYTITNYTPNFIGFEDRKDTYTIEFEDDNVRDLIPLLDSLCNTSANWMKGENDYIYRMEFFEGEVYETFTINPNSRAAEFVHYKR